MMASVKGPDQAVDEVDLDDLDDDDDDEDEELPDISWSKVRLLAYAEEELELDIPDRTNKQDILELINAELDDLEE
jgi:hypothetical protein